MPKPRLSPDVLDRQTRIQTATEELMRSPLWTSYLRPRLAELRADRVAQLVTGRGLDDVERLRAEIRLLDQIADLPATDHATATRTLDGAG